MSVDELGRAAAEALVSRVAGEVDAEAMLRSVHRTRTRRRVAMILPVAVAVVAAAVAIQVAHRDNAGPPLPSTPTPSNGALVESIETTLAVITGHLDQFPQDVARFSSVQFIEDGSELVYEGGSGGLEAINVTTGNARLVTACGPHVCPFIRLSPDGTRAALWTHVGRQDGLQVRELATGHTSFFPTKDSGWLEWSPDGKSLAITGTKGVYVMDLSSGVARMIYRYPSSRGGGYEAPLHSSWSPDGTAIAFLDPRSVQGKHGTPRLTDWTLTTVDVDGTHVHALRDVGGCYCVGLQPPQVAWSPDGRKIAVSAISIKHARSNGVYLINPDGTGWTAINSGETPADLAWQPLQQR